MRLDELGRVIDGASEPGSFAMSNGQPVAAFAVFRATGASDLTAGDAAKVRLAAPRADYPRASFAPFDDATV